MKKLNLLLFLMAISLITIGKAQNDEEDQQRLEQALTGITLSTKKVDLSGLGITALGDALTPMTKLTDLNLSGNRLSAVSRLSSRELTGLDLSNNLFRQLPDLSLVRKLRKLSLRNNNLADLDPALGELAALEELDLSHNQLETFPDTLSKLAALKVLHAGHNLLTQPDLAITSLPKLEALGLEDNKISDVHPNIARLSGTLKRLNLAGNPLFSSLFPLLSKLATEFIDFSAMTGDGHKEAYQRFIKAAHGLDSLPKQAPTADNNLVQTTKARIQRLLPKTQIEFGI